MKEITFAIGPRINDERVKDLVKVLDGIGAEDEIKITMDTSDAHEADDIFEVLDERRFGYYAKGSGSDQYNIIASKKYFQEEI